MRAVDGMTVKDVYDVAVIGGGSAGVAASVAAAGLGARTLLVEAGSVLGGNVTRAGVHTICGLHSSVPPGAPAELAQTGFPRRLARALARVYAVGPAERAGRVHFLPLDPPRYGRFLETLCGQTKNLDSRLDAALLQIDLAQDTAPPTRLEIGGPDSVECVAAQVVVDASGDGVTSSLGSAESAMAPCEALQCASYILRVSGVKTAGIEGFKRLQLSVGVAGATRRGRLPAGCESVVVRTALTPGEIHLTLNVPRPDDRDYAPLDPECRDFLDARARKHGEAVIEFLIATHEAFAGARVVSWPETLGVRETRRLLGRVVITEEEILEGRRHPDEVAISSWPVELWDDHRRARFEHPRGPSSIPLGALISRSHPRLAMAGRCMSATHEALGSLRVIGTALATGEAAGIAAAIAADQGQELAAVAPGAVRDRIAQLATREIPS